ncbi:energy transducer TonB [Sphingopyxis indica]|uniref:energy transducer TonB n=1 Tax=Sphingopyxis indica TaxID=436663 RepID=UPI00293907AD|nr:TonB family protein [Sphingopyxis indica]WOF44063.1 energy transducer TonB [Sphingopyxis indica]
MALGLLSSGAAPAKDREPLRLAPSSKWHLDYAKDSCRIGRSFGEGDQKVTILIDRYEPGDPFRLQLIGKPVRTRRSDGIAELRFGPVGPMQERSYYSANASDKTPAIVLRGAMRIIPQPDEPEFEDAAGPDAGDDEAAAEKAARIAIAKAKRITPAEEAAATFLEVRKPAHQPLLLETGPLDKALAAMRQCTDELLDHWGIDVAKHATLSRPVIPKGNPGRWVLPGDYPPGKAWMGQRAIVMFRLNVDENGSVSACHIQNSIGDKAFDEAVCDALKRRARFEPALDSDGRPIPSYWLNAVNFHV